MVAGLVFALGLSLVLIGGGQIFTGDVLMVMAWASSRLKSVRVARLGTGVDWQFHRLPRHCTARGACRPSLVRRRTARPYSAAHRRGKGFVALGRAFVLGMLCNTLVCLAIWLSLSSRFPAHRTILTVLPIAAFVAAGFEHAVANMYFIGFGLMVKHTASDTRNACHVS